MIASIVLATILPGFVLTQSTPRADWYAPVDTPQLRVDVRACEKFLAKTEHALGVTVPRFAYYRVHSPSDVAAHTGTYAYGVAFPDPLHTIVSADACSHHEIAHLAFFQLGRPAPFWEEASASMLSGECYGVVGRIAIHDAREHRMAWSHIWTSFDQTTVRAAADRDRYDMACAFAADLVRRKGMGMFIGFFRGTKTFEETYGLAPAKAWNRLILGDKR